MKKVLIGIIILIVIGIWTTVFTVSMTEQAVILQFGKPVRTILEPGLNFKLPVPLQNAIVFDKRLL